MPEQFRIATVPVKRDKPAQIGENSFDVYAFEVERPENGGAAVGVELLKKPGNAPPQVGQVVLGDLRPGKGDYPPTLKLHNPNVGGGRGGGKTYDRQPEHPLNLARTLHTAALGTAPKLIEQMLTLNLEDVQAPKTKAEYLKLVSGVTAWIVSSYPPEVLQRAKASGGGS